jgi:poly-beta-hydroxybutyrate-responsive repressor
MTDQSSGPDGETEAKPGPRLHGDILATSLLAFLKMSSAYGYHLVQQLGDAGLPQFDSGTVYRTLRQLEKTGLVSSFWDTSASGPARRMYKLTAAGQVFLMTWFEALERHQAVLRKALEAMKTEDDASLAKNGAADADTAASSGR